jgi:hypothetical protein
MSLLLRVVYPTPALVSVQFVQRTESVDAVRGYAQPTTLEWQSPAWVAIRLACAVEEGAA